MSDCKFCGHPETQCFEVEESEHCREKADAREIDRIMAMSEGDLRAEIMAEGRDPDEVVAGMKRELSAMLDIAQDRDRWKSEAASWRRVAEQLQERIVPLEEALRPFAVILAAGEPVGPIPRGLLDSKLTRADLRLATSLLAPAAIAKATP